MPNPPTGGQPTAGSRGPPDTAADGAAGRDGGRQPTGGTSGPAGKSGAGHASGTRGKVLVIDDEPVILESTALLVQALGYQAVTLRDASDILETIEREKPGLVLQDLKMPGLNVAGLIAALRLNPETAELPVVFFSAGGDVGTVAARYDVWGFLAKPFSRQELARVLNGALGPPRRAAPVAGRAVQRELGNAFHDYWNLLAALSSYIEILHEAQGLPPEAQRAVRGLDEVILKLEAKTDRLRAYLMALVDTLESASSPASAPSTPTPSSSAPPAAQRPPRPAPRMPGES